MKKTISMLCCIMLLLSSTVIQTNAGSSPPDTTNEYLYNVIRSDDTRKGLGFEDGAEGVYTIGFIYVIAENEEIISHYIVYETIEYRCEYIKASNISQQVEAELILNDFSANKISEWDCLKDAAYPGAERLRSASHYYNCHSYAWYSKSTTNTYWIDDPWGYYYNNSYYDEVEDPDIGDIICYYAANGKILHSGIVNAVNNQSSNGECGNSNTVEVISKWGMSGLYKHNGYECPYTNYTEHSADNPPAVEVRYFRRHTHVFTYSYKFANPSVHTATCSTCDYSTIENHTYKSLPGGASRCTKCGYTSSGQIIMSDKPKPVEQ